MKALPWFRMYHEALDDEKLRLLACEDRWHFVALLCCKAKGILDEDGALLKRKVAVKLGLSTSELDEVSRRLAEVGLIEQASLQPLSWDFRQMQSDKDETNAQRQSRYRAAHKQSITDSNALRNAPVTGIDTEGDTDKEEEEEEREKTAPAKRSPTPRKPAIAKPDSVDQQTWDDWLTLRKAKKAPVTLTTVEGAANEATKAGMSLEAFLKVWCRRGSQGLEAAWLKDSERATATSAPAETTYQRSMRERYEEATGKGPRRTIDITPTCLEILQ
jgi:hypothetical protein